ncbi:MAG TPA: Na+/H+ antiporter subunit C [Burkholderiales bacterium]|nr:Na+/H+ antiporter subunit C [Burkholderiales bacterium]
MELLTAVGVGVLTTSGIYLLLRERTFSVLLGLTLLSYAVNLFVFSSGRLKVGAPPLIGHSASHADPLAQALVLTAIVISFAMTAFVVVLAIAAYRRLGGDDADHHGGEQDR